MNQPLLSIQIPTIVGREKEYASIEEVIRNQCVAIGEEPRAAWSGNGIGGWDSRNVEYIYHRDNKELTIGEKRNMLYQRANALYSWQIDDDDTIAPGAIEKILNIIRQQQPDCITFQEHCTINGVEFKSNHSLKYDDWKGDGVIDFLDGFAFHRTPFFKSIIRTSIAQSVPVSFSRFGEDHDWAQRLKPYLKSEVHIPEDIYFYQHNSTEFNERYGIQ